MNCLRYELGKETMLLEYPIRSQKNESELKELIIKPAIVSCD